MARTAVITGGAGVGKSLVVASALESFTPRPAVVLRGTARVHAPAPYDWLAAVLSGRSMPDLDIPAEALAWLAQHPDAPSERFAPAALLRLAVRVVRSLVRDQQAVLVVEDLHALDPASLNLIGELATAPDLPVLLLVTSRPPDLAVSPQLAARTLARLSGTPRAIRQHLGPLSAAEVGAVLAEVYAGELVSVEAAEMVWQRTGGNPYWLMELLAMAAPEPDLTGSLAVRCPNMSGWPRRGGHRERRRRARVAQRRCADLSADEADLTARENEVLSCLAEGMSNKQVAHQLGISIRTVAVHVSNLLRKTQSASRTEAALWALQRTLTADVGAAGR